MTNHTLLVPNPGAEAPVGGMNHDPASVWRLGSRSSIILVAVTCGFLFFYGITHGQLYRTESLRAIIAAQFLKSGNWIVPTLYGEPLFTKPPGMYAAIAFCSLPFGQVSELTARLPSAISATVAVFFFYFHFKRIFGLRGGLVAAFILPTSFMWLDKASAAEIDMMQVAWVTGAILCFLRALEIAESRTQPKESVQLIAYRVTGLGEISSQNQHGAAFPAAKADHEWFWWQGALLCVAGGVLTKWTAPAFFYGTVIPLLWWRGRLGLLFSRKHVVSALVGAAICLAWIGLAVSMAGWDAFYKTVSQEALMRLSPGHHHRPYPWKESLAHPLRLLAACLPWAVFALLTVRPGFAQIWKPREQRLLQALHCWTWPNVLFWSLIPEHAPRHSFPLFPGVAGLAAFVWIGWFRGSLSPPRLPSWAVACWCRLKSISPKPGIVFITLIGLWFVAKICFVHAVIPERNRNREPREKGQLIAAIVPPEKTLYLFKLKDEGIMFYYDRPVSRLAGPRLLPSSEEAIYCILDGVEWRTSELHGKAEIVEWLQDEQGADIVLVRLNPPPHEDSE